MCSLQFKNVSKIYSNGIAAVDGITFCVPEGEIVGLIGPNGAGKSTAIKMGAKLLDGYSGEIRLNEVDITKIKNRNYAVSYIPDIPVYFDFMTLGEHLDFLDDLYAHQGVMNKNDLIETLSLSDYLLQYPGSVSKGTLQKLMISLALLRPFDFLIADEPFSGLDPEHIYVLRDLFIRVKKLGKGILLSTHRLELAESYCDSYVFLKKGEVLASGKKNELLDIAWLDKEASITDIYMKISGGIK